MEEWRKEKLDFILTTLPWLDPREAEEYLEGCENDSEVEALLEALTDNPNVNNDTSEWEVVEPVDVQCDQMNAQLTTTNVQNTSPDNENTSTNVQNTLINAATTVPNATTNAATTVQNATTNTETTMQNATTNDQNPSTNLQNTMTNGPNAQIYGPNTTTNGPNAPNTSVDVDEEFDAETEGRINTYIVKLAEIVSDADPEYLQKRCRQTRGDLQAYQALVMELLALGDYPKLADFRARQQLAQQQRYLQGLSVEECVEYLHGRKPGTRQTYECTICCNDDLEKASMGFCQLLPGHPFCLECIKRYVSEEIGQGRIRFRCLDESCDAELWDATVAATVEEAVWQSVVEQRQAEEVTKAGLQGLESCPFCTFQVIIEDDEETVFRCQKCKRDSCRLCKEPNHHPQTCEELKVDQQKDTRTFLENRMAEAMIRQCPKCNKRFVKSSGCNKMTCSCGTVLCYVCRKVIQDYNHFEENPHAANNNNKCPLWSEAADVHRAEVAVAAQEAKNTLDPDIQLLYDPTAGL